MSEGFSNDGGRPGRRLTAPSRIRQLIGKHGLRIKKSLGQNFLVDQNILDKIVAASEVHPNDTVIEIGPGLGALTEALAERVRRVIAIEIDDQLIPVLRSLFAEHPNVEIVHGDALRVDLATLLAGERVVKVIANLPYYITSPLIMHFLESDLPIERMVIMMQAEVADRIAARPGSKEYGSLSVAVQYRAHVERVTKAPRTVFFPQPKVDSAVLCLRMRPFVPQARDQSLFKAVVRAAFGQRRKTLRRALASLVKDYGAAIDEVLQRAGIDPTARGEDLPVESFVHIADALHSVIQ